MNARSLRQQLVQQGLSAYRLPLPTQVYFGVPTDIRIEGPPGHRSLCWSETERTSEWPERTDLKCLFQFAALADSDDEQDFLRFADRWGVLELCGHEAPYTHSHEPPAWDLTSDMRQKAAQVAASIQNPQQKDTLAETALAQVATTAPMSKGKRRLAEGSIDLLDLHRVSAWCEPKHSEPLDAWRAWAGRARAMLRITAHLNRQQDRHPSARTATPAAEWRPLYFDAEISEHADRSDWFAHERAKLAIALQQWTLLGRVTPTFIESSDGGVQLGFDAHGVFGALAAQLAALIATGEGVYACAACGAPWPSNRHPRTDREFYCEECRPEIALKWKREDAARRRSGQPPKRQLRFQRRQEGIPNGKTR